MTKTIEINCDAYYSFTPEELLEEVIRLRLKNVEYFAELAKATLAPGSKLEIIVVQKPHSPL